MPAREPTPADMPTSNRPINKDASINDDASRLDGPAKVSGAAKYGRDVYPPGRLFVGLVRCPYGAATLSSSDGAAAAAIPGVLEVEVNVLEGKYHGQRVGRIVAESPLALKRARRALRCVWSRKPVVTRLDEAVPIPPPDDATRRVLADAPLSIEAVYSTPVIPHACLETHGGSIEHKGDRAVAYVSTQGTSAARDGLDKALGLPQSAIEVSCEYIGGGFGSKLGGPGKETMAAAAAAAKHKRSAWCFSSRSEDQTDTGNRPSSRTLARIAFKKDGTILGGEVKTWGGVGPARGGGGCNVPSGRYNFDNVEKTHKDVNLNHGPPMPARAPAFPQGAFAEELLLDEIAAACALDPLALRRTLVSDAVYREMFDLGAPMIGWANRRANGSQTSTMRIGYGVGTASWHSAGPGGKAEVVINRDGSVEARTGTQDPGTGTRTAVGIVAADALSVPLAAVTVRIGHSPLPPGPASGGSVVTPTIAPTMAVAARDARRRLFEFLAQRDGGAPEDYDLRDGTVTRRGGAALTWKQACERLPAEGITGKNTEKADAGKGNNQGVQFVKVAVDADTGVVHPLHVVAIQSCGRVVFRKGAESQIMGSVIQGLSYALFEQQVLDRRVGTMLNDNLEWFKILGPVDMPHIEPVLWTRGQTGVRGIGEPPIVPTAGAVACAVYNAIGAPVRHLPMTPDKVLAALQGGGA